MNDLIKTEIQKKHPYSIGKGNGKDQRCSAYKNRLRRQICFFNKRSKKTYGSSLLDGGVSLNTTRIMLGHSDEKTTLKYYCFDTHTELEKMNLMENALKIS